MKKLLLVGLMAVGLFASCGKDGDSPQSQNQGSVGTVTIAGTSYKTVVIGNKTWTAVNYNGPGGVNYDNGVNDAAYGKFYTIAESRAITLPAGWRLPTRADFEGLLKSVEYSVDKDGFLNLKPEGAAKLKSTAGWSNVNGTNSSGFNAYPAGTCYILASKTPFDDKGSETTFISSTDEPGVDYMGNKGTATVNFRIYAFKDIYGKISDGGDISSLSIYGSANFKYSIRFVKDN